MTYNYEPRSLSIFEPTSEYGVMKHRYGYDYGWVYYDQVPESLRHLANKPNDVGTSEAVFETYENALCVAQALSILNDE